MPATRNLRVRNAHSASYNTPQLRCTFEECMRLFRSKSGLTKHIRACHPQHGISSQPTTPELSSSRSPLPEDSLLYCSAIGCSCSFKNRAGLTQHTRTFHPHLSDSVQPVSPAPAPSPTSTQSGYSHQEHVESPPSILMPSPKHTPSPPSSPTPHQMDEDNLFSQNDNMMDYDTDRDGDQASGESSSHPSSPIHNQMEENHQFYEYDNDDDMVDYGANQGATGEPQRSSPSASPPPECLKRSYHPVINGKYYRDYLATHKN